jgi:tRNA(Ser,Leu) C12 N-acetylase TAN1
MINVVYRSVELGVLLWVNLIKRNMMKRVSYLQSGSFVNIPKRESKKKKKKKKKS